MLCVAYYVTLEYILLQVLLFLSETLITGDSLVMGYFSIVVLLLLQRGTSPILHSIRFIGHVEH